MPSYLYICDNCDNRWEEIRNVGDHARTCPKCNSTKVGRNYKDEFAGVGVESDDWDEGYNYGISYHYKNKQDLLREIRARGFEPSLHDNGLKPVRRELYGAERRMLKKTAPAPEIIIED